MIKETKFTAAKVREFYRITPESAIYQRGNFFFKIIDGKEVEVERPKGLNKDRDAK